jgi:hypothetical protein
MVMGKIAGKHINSHPSEQHFSLPGQSSSIKQPANSSKTGGHSTGASPSAGQSPSFSPWTAETANSTPKAATKTMEVLILPAWQ